MLILMYKLDYSWKKKHIYINATREYDSLFKPKPKPKLHAM